MATQTGAAVSDPQIGAMLGAASNAAFLMTILVAKHFNFGDGADAAKKCFESTGSRAWCQPARTCVKPLVPNFSFSRSPACS